MGTADKVALGILGVVVVGGIGYVVMTSMRPPPTPVGAQPVATAPDAAALKRNEVNQTQRDAETSLREREAKQTGSQVGNIVGDVLGGIGDAKKLFDDAANFFQSFKLF